MTFHRTPYRPGTYRRGDYTLASFDRRSLPPSGNATLRPVERLPRAPAGGVFVRLCEGLAFVPLALMFLVMGLAVGLLHLVDGGRRD